MTPIDLPRADYLHKSTVSSLYRKLAYVVLLYIIYSAIKFSIGPLKDIVELVKRTIFLNLISHLTKS